MKKISGRVVQVSRTPVFFGTLQASPFLQVVRSLRISSTVILTDTNTRELCLPVLLGKVPALSSSLVLAIDPGESSKTLATVSRLWSELAAAGADRKTLILCLGGGVVTDLGGFTASTFMRGIPCIHIPTSLIGQADASIGGKTAVNTDGLKNQAGTFYPASAVFIDSAFLQTLPLRHLRSGLAEVIKTALVCEPRLWRRLSGRPIAEMLEADPSGPFWQEIVRAAAAAKNRIVMRDFRERNIRKALNFGHTFGHAFESASLAPQGTEILHGDAVAAGMICAVYLSVMKSGLDAAEADRIIRFLHGGFGKVPSELLDAGILAEIMRHDKKSDSGGLRFSLIEKPGTAVVNVPVNEAEAGSALKYYTETEFTGL